MTLKTVLKSMTPDSFYVFFKGKRRSKVTLLAKRSQNVEQKKQGTSSYSVVSYMLLTQDKKRDSFTVAAEETGYPTNGQGGSPFKCKKGFTQLTDEINVVECSPEQTKTFDRDAL